LATDVWAVKVNPAADSSSAINAKACPERNRKSLP
jgi:hypothetical protein